jgi:hypothetical protein
MLLMLLVQQSSEHEAGSIQPKLNRRISYHLCILLEAARKSVAGFTAVDSGRRLTGDSRWGRVMWLTTAGGMTQMTFAEGTSHLESNGRAGRTTRP